jgi:hypothetical protein
MVRFKLKARLQPTRSPATQRRGDSPVEVMKAYIAWSRRSFSSIDSGGGLFVQAASGGTLATIISP